MTGAEKQARWRKRHPESNAKIHRKFALIAYHKNKMKFRERFLRSKYGLSQTDYDRMLSDQHGACKICGKESTGERCKYFHIDHSHETGHIRGLLCTGCNLALGRYEKKKEIFEKYLRECLQ